LKGLIFCCFKKYCWIVVCTV